MNADLILVHGVYGSGGSNALAAKQRASDIAKHGGALGICGYEWLNGRKKRLANLALRRARSTAQAPEAVEIIRLNESAMRESLNHQHTRTIWKESLGCAHSQLDPLRSFLLIGKPRQQVEGPASGQRLLWFGRGLNHLTEREFIAHYTEHHGPLVAAYAQQLGIKHYWQLPNELDELGNTLRTLGLGHASCPDVFAELTMSIPPISPSALRTRRFANSEIAADEKRHIDFSRSMLLLV